MSKKVSAFQVYSEDQVHQRHSRSYRHTAPRSQSQSNKYESSPHRGGRTSTTDWREDVKVDSRVQGRHSPSPEIRRDRAYDYDKYDKRRDDSNSLRDSRYGEDIRQNDTRDRQSVQTRYRSDEQYDHRSWERDDRRDDYTADRDRGGHIRKDDYGTTMDVQREVVSKNVQSSLQYTDSDEECLHESLRRKKVDRFSAQEADRRWSSDDDYSDYREIRKRVLGGSAYHSPSPQPVKDWRDERPFCPEQDRQCKRTAYSDIENSEGSVSPPIKKRKVKGSKKTVKGKVKKRKTALSNPIVASSKIQSLMDVKIPSSVKKQVEQSTTSTASLRRFGESRTEFKFGHRIEDTSQNLPQSRDEDRNTSKYDDSNRNRSRYDDDGYQDHRREPAYGHRESESDRRGHHGHKDSYSSRHSPDYDRRAYHHPDDDYDRGRDRQRRTSFSRDGRSNADVAGTRRRRQSSMERRDWPRSGNRAGQRDRSPAFGNYSDSDQDSDRRRSWRDERRDRQPKKKDEDKNKGQKGEKKSKSKQDTKNSQRDKKSTDAKKESHVRDADHHQDTTAARMQMHQLKEGMAIFLTHPQKICMRGRAKLRVMAGEASVMGYTLKGSKTYDLFSPSTSSLLTISTSSAEKEKPLRKVVQSLDMEEKTVKEFMTGAVILWATKLDFPAADYICTLPPFTQLFRYNFDRLPNPQSPAATSNSDQVKVGATFLSVEQSATMYLKVSEDFDEALKKWTTAVKSSKVGPIGLLCGGVNSGKSTFSRFMINSALTYASKVCYLDCDVGQTEFSPPGTVALTVVDKPVFGPPFCHQRVAESMVFYGMVNPAEGATRYVDCVQHVLKVYQDMEHPPPLIVNTLGWNEGLGLMLFVDVLHLISPDLVIQMNVSTEVLNFPPVTPDFVHRQPGWLYNTEPAEEDDEKDENRKKHEHITIQSLVSSRNDPTRVKLTPKNMRDLSLLAHLMQGFPPTKTLTSASTYTIPWNRFAMHICHSDVPQRLLVNSLGASVVALCKADISQANRISEDMPLFFYELPVCECLGYGIVRGLDHKAQTLLLVTPMSRHHLAQVNTLLKGSITIPDQLLLKQGHMEDVPHIDALEPAMALAPVRPRTRMPRRH